MQSLRGVGGPRRENHISFYDFIARLREIIRMTKNSKVQKIFANLPVAKHRGYVSLRSLNLNNCSPGIACLLQLVLRIPQRDER